MFSVTRESHDQADGRFWVTETHQLSDGSERVVQYLCERKGDTDAIAQGRHDALEQDIKQMNSPEFLRAQASDIRREADRLITSAETKEAVALSEEAKPSG